MRGLELTIRGEVGEIAALVLELQGRRSTTDIGVNSVIQTGSFYLDEALYPITFESL